MKQPDLTFRKLVLVCQNLRSDGRDCCMRRGAEDLYHDLKLAVAAVDPSIRVSQTGCLGSCLSGPIVVIMPDNIWLGDVRKEDIPAVVERIISSK